MRTMKIPGNLDFDRISRVVMGKEALGLLFKDASIVTEPDVEPFNRVRFDFEPDGRSPPLCIIQAAEDPAPADHRQEWNGQMLIEGEIRGIVLYRSEL
jgi:hypothetical protein